MSRIRKKHSPQFKFKVALEATKGIKTLSELTSEHAVHQAQISQWRKQLLEDGPGVFSKENGCSKKNDVERTQLYEQIGQLTVELNWFKKKFQA
jgi:transposase-like protein